MSLVPLPTETGARLRYLADRRFPKAFAMVHAYAVGLVALAHGSGPRSTPAGEDAAAAEYAACCQEAEALVQDFHRVWPGLEEGAVRRRAIVTFVEALRLLLGARR